MDWNDYYERNFSESDVVKMMDELKVTIYVINSNPESEHCGKTMEFELPMTDGELERSIEIIGNTTANYIKPAIVGCSSDNKYDFIEGLSDLRSLEEMNDVIVEINKTYDCKHVLAYSEASGYELKESVERYEDYSRWYAHSSYKDLVEEEMSEYFGYDDVFCNMLINYIDHESFAKEEMEVLETKNGKIVLY